MSTQYVILPKKETGELLKKYEILIYVCIRRYMNKDTMEAYPSLNTIVRDSGCSKPTVSKIIKKIQEKGYFTVTYTGSYTIYKFNNEKSFEPFSYEFLDNKNISKSAKLQILCTQQYMYKNNGVGKISMSDTQLAKLTGLDRHTIVKNNNALINSGYASQVTLQARESEAGCFRQEMIYHLDELGQAIVFAIQNHEERLQNTEDGIKELKELVQKQNKTIEQQSKDIQILLNNEKMRQKKEATPREFSFE